MATSAIYRQHPDRYQGGAHPPVELYDLLSDPWEQENLSGRPELADIERGLDEQLWQWMAGTGDPLLQGPVPSPAYLESMQALEQSDHRG
jgi:hypothetical protein